MSLSTAQNHDVQGIASMLDQKCFVKASRKARGGLNNLAMERNPERFVGSAIPHAVQIAVYNHRQQGLEDELAPTHGTAVAPKHGRPRHMTHMYELEDQGFTFNPHHYALPVTPAFWTPKL